MGTVNEFIDFINREKMPTKLQQKHLYAHITIDKEMKKLRRVYRANLRKSEKGN